MSGRKRGSWFQKRCINVHSLSVRAGCVGRDGRLPVIVANMAATGRLLLNGTAPVNAWVIPEDDKPDLDEDNPFVTYLDHDHGERENIRFFAQCSLLVEDLWGGPPRGMTPII